MSHIMGFVGAFGPWHTKKVGIDNMERRIEVKIEVPRDRSRELSKLVKIAVLPDDMGKIERLRTILIRKGMVDRDWLMPLVEEYIATEEVERGDEPVVVNIGRLLDILENDHSLIYDRSSIHNYKDRKHWTEGVHFYRRKNGGRKEIVYVIDEVLPLLTAGVGAEKARKRFIAQGVSKKRPRAVREKEKRMTKREEFLQPVEETAVIRGYKG